MRVFATAGHVDHGKSTLIKTLTGTNPDRWAEEQERGLTIDLGFAHLDTPDGQRISFIDVPGHVRYLGNMLAGVGGVNGCLFVVDANEGWMPQTEEHLRILQLTGAPAGVIALTKADLCDSDHLELATLEVIDHVEGTFLEGAAIVPVSAPTGAGMAELVEALAALARSTPASVDRDRPRLFVDRVFAAKGSGTVVTGTSRDGSFAVGDHVVVGPRQLEARIRGIQTLGESVEHIGPGHRVALNLAGIDHRELQRGDCVVKPGQWFHSDRVDARLQVLDSLGHKVSRRGAYTVHIGSDEIPARLRVIGPESVEPGATAFVRLHLDRPVPLLPHDHFILRESGRRATVGGGQVLDVNPVRPASGHTRHRLATRRDRTRHDHGRRSRVAHRRIDRTDDRSLGDRSGSLRRHEHERKGAHRSRGGRRTGRGDVRRHRAGHHRLPRRCVARQRTRSVEGHHRSIAGTSGDRTTANGPLCSPGARGHLQRRPASTGQAGRVVRARR